VADSTQYLVLDIETIPDLKLWQDPSKEGAFPPTYAHQVIMVGCMLLDANYQLQSLELFPRIAGPGPGPEAAPQESDILQSFSEFVEDQRPALVTYNGRSFDLPVLALRSLRCGVPMAWYYNERGIRHRYSEDGHIDLCDWLADHGASRANSLDALARLIGLPGKIGIDGSQVHDLYKQGKIEEIRNYCLADVAQTALLFLRFRLLQGVLDSHQYREAVSGLTESLAKDQRLGALTSAIDASRLWAAA
jgi:predicted PolB exonuclease-like 3'-5' exonuclease